MLQRRGPADFVAQPWKNGGGTTYEIARWPEGADVYDARASLATVERSGPFSVFPGYRRYSYVVGPNPIVLAGVELVCHPQHRSLDGALAVDAVLPSGPTKLLNLLVRPGTHVGHGAPMGHVRFLFAFEDIDILPAHHALISPEPVEVRTSAARVVWFR